MDPEFFSKMKEEIPAFLDFLKNRSLTTMKKSRMWFAFSDYRTPEFDRIVRYCRDSVEVELAELLLDIMKKLKKEEVCFSLKIIKKIAMLNGIETTRNQLKAILSASWHLIMQKNRYTSIDFRNNEYSLFSVSNGYFFRVTKALLEKI